MQALYKAEEPLTHLSSEVATMHSSFTTQTQERWRVHAHTHYTRSTVVVTDIRNLDKTVRVSLHLLPKSNLSPFTNLLYTYSTLQYSTVVAWEM